MIITIDGPAGSGKSSTAREVARRLGYRHLDSGAFYRALTLAALRAGIAPSAWDSLSPTQIEAFQVRGQPIEGGYSLHAGADDVTADIRSPDVNAHVSRIAALPVVRTWLLDRLREAGSSGRLVTDGRDMGTVVFPSADLKVFLVADPAVRARRRLQEQGLGTSAADVAEEVRRLERRDRADSERETAPLRKPEGAVEIDTTHLSFEEQVDAIVQAARAHGA